MRSSEATRAILLLGLVLLAAPAGAEEDARPWEQQPFLGLSVRDTPDGPVVGWISPGPLGGRGFESTSGIRRGDNLVSVDGKTLDAPGLKEYLRGLEPGRTVRIVTRRSPQANPEAAVPKGGPGGEERTLEVALAARADWAGTIGRGLGERVIPASPRGELESLVLEAAAQVGARAGQEGVGGGLDALLAYLARVQEENLDPNAIAAVVQAFRRPLAVDAVEAGIVAEARAALAGGLGGLETFTRSVLDLPDPAHAIAEAMGKDAADLDDAGRRAMVRFAAQHLEGYQTEKPWRRQVEQLLRTLRDSVYVYDDHADDHVRTIAQVAGPRVDVLLALPLALWRLAPAAWEAEAAAHAGDAPLTPLPEALQGAVEGDVLWAGEDALGHLAVVGGPGANRYDMQRIGAVYDVGGDDRYVYRRAGEHGAIALRIVIDLDGNDVHESAEAFEGPATAVLGFSLLDDRKGNDVYRTSAPFGVAAGAWGFGLLLDASGDDVYEAFGEDSGWGIGAGFYGAGLLVDRAGHDVYRGEKLVQGVGGPRALGAVLDVAGNDVYTANGPHFGSVYGTPAVYVGMSQGFGIGVRGYAAGGLGLLYDGGGHDRYEAGEFSQAGGYYWGFGILHDVAGDDLYYGNRYGQAFSAHQAVGVLVDEAGDDTYWSMTAASQGGTWDQSIGLLLDRAGNDSYRCDGLGQGGASMQAIALLVDLGGDDRYAARPGATQGQGGGNTYHYDADKVFSFSGLFDLGGGRDAYSSGRANDATVGTGAFDERNPAASSLYGVCVDR